MDCRQAGSSVHGILQARILGWVAIFLLQEIFLTQKLNPGLLHCRQILYWLSYMSEWVSESCSVRSDSLRLHGLYSSWNSPGQNTRVGSLSHLQGIFPTQGSNSGIPHCRQIPYQLSHKGSPLSLHRAWKLRWRQPGSSCELSETYLKAGKQVRESVRGRQTWKRGSVGILHLAMMTMLLITHIACVY